jgi:hypothetical protein
MRLRRQTAPPSPLEQAEPTMAAIRRAEEATAARLAAEKADQADIDAARRQAGELLTAASRRAQQLVARRREAVRAEFDAHVQREQTASAAKIARVIGAARDSHDLAVQLAVAFVLTGEAARCSSR